MEVLSSVTLFQLLLLESASAGVLPAHCLRGQCCVSDSTALEGKRAGEGLLAPLLPAHHKNCRFV